MARRPRAPRQRAATAAASLLGVALLASACAGGSTGSSPSSSKADPSEYATDGTFTYALPSDPGNLDPLQTAGAVAIALNQFTYDRLVSFDKEGKAGSNLAAKWTADAGKASFTLAKGITCSDGTALTATDVKASLDYVSDPANASPLLSLGVPAGITTADDTAGTVEVTSPTPNAFLLQNLAFVPIVCKTGMADRSTLKQSSDGTGPYTITEAVPDDHYTLTRRKDYTWGIKGGTTAEKGLPEKVVIQVVKNESTAANLMVTGKINAAVVAGPDSARLEKTSGVSSTTTPEVSGEVWFNHREGHGAASADVREALVMALDRTEIAKIATGGKGKPMTAQALIEPTGCQYDAATSSVPKKDVAGAKKLIASSGIDTSKPLTMLYTTGNTDVDAAVELMVKQWKSELGVTVTAKALADSDFLDALFKGDSWDLGWVPVNFSTPAQAVGFVSGGSPLDTAAPGSNFSSIDNADYTAAAAEAIKTVGKPGCDLWQKGEEALYSAADLYPISQTPTPLFLKDAELTTVGGALDPTSIRVLQG